MKIAIITWGLSNEREIALRSANFQQHTLQSIWYKADIFVLPEQTQQRLQTYPNYDICIPCIHGIGWEDGQITAIANTLNITSLFGDIGSHAMCLDKYLSTLFLQSFGYRCPKTRLVQSTQEREQRSSVPGDYIIKPNNGWSSLDTLKFNDKQQANQTAANILKYSDIIIQQCIQGREFSITVYGHYTNPQILATTEILQTNDEIFDYTKKYEEDGHEITPADVPTQRAAQLTQDCLTIYQRCKLEDYARIDCIINDQWIRFLEINNIPWVTENSIIPRACAHTPFKTFANFLDHIIKQKI